jgi:hypothetical protein
MSEVTGKRLYRPRGMDRTEWFWTRVIKGDGCWGWNGCHTGVGYGTFCVGVGQMRLAHRIIYELVIGPIPDGLQIDHLCRNRGCVNPAHLEAVTQAENLRRGRFGILCTHCPKGHPYDEVNTYRDPGGGRRCRECHRVNRRHPRLRTVSA